ncbi:major facilitator superfamily domain-containing protein [Achaetomium macrosporum]|uniref:Major facilitator superfamily domain-containing protein n=1 Tax=Achaetomium macrosporum TaxID=79813 RepID=A0AAN7CJV6_9PEZI|nr:major facilitator superfamily domain-containing protein [Achaetomium macrosporum]
MDASSPVIDRAADDRSENITSAGPEDSFTTETQPFSVFTNGQKRWVNWVASFGAMFSTLNSYIYFPAVIPIASDLNVSVALVNLTITCYLVVAGISPAIMGDLADHEGRRPAYIIMCVLTVGANVGLALQRSYPALIVLRMVQAAGSSGAFGAAHGVVSDISPIAERGSFTGTVILFTNTAPSFGPIISGALAETVGWRWIFWLLTILTATYSVVLVLFFPETQRKLVGNGSRRVQGLLYRNLFSTVTSHRHVIDKTTAPSRPKHNIPNPFACLPMLAYKNNLHLVLFSSITYALRMTLQASLGSQCPEIYRLNSLQAGLIFLPPGVAGAVAAKLQGVLIDRNYKRMCTQLDGAEFRRGEDISGFPIEKARLKGATVMIAVTVAATVGYGVALMTYAHISVMLIMQFVTSYTTSSVFSITNTLLTDLNQTRAASVRGASNLIRCLLAGGCIAALEPVTERIGLGWCFGVYAMLQALVVPLIWRLETKGLTWREERTARQAGEGISQPA